MPGEPKRAEITLTKTERMLMETSNLSLGRLRKAVQAELAAEVSRHSRVLTTLFKAHGEELPDGVPVQWDEETGMLRFGGGA